MVENLIPSASRGESKVFYYKMKDDYHRIFAELATGDVESQVAENACAACAGDTKIAEGQTYSLFQKSSSACLQATTLARRLSKQEHCTALAELTSRISAIMMVGAGSGDDPFVKIMCLITFLINRLQEEAPSEASHTSYRLKGRGRRQRRKKKENLEADDAKHSSKLEAVVARSTKLDRDISTLHLELGALAER